MPFHLAEPSRPRAEIDVTVDPARCVRAPRCTACADACPAGAVALAPRPAIGASCHSCGACIASCPTRAFRARRRTDAAIAAEATRGPQGTVAFACDRHPAAPAGAVRIPCLGRLTPGILLRAIADGAASVELHRPACEACALSRAGLVLAPTLRTAAALLALAGGLSGSVREVVAAAPPLARSAPEQPALARRELLGRLVPWRAALGRGTGDAGDDRALLLETLDRLAAPAAPATRPPPAPEALRGATGWIVGRDGCDGCGACAAVCPARALVLERADDRATLSLHARACTGCGACAAICASGALALAAPPSLAAALAGTPSRVLEALGRRCQTCGARVTGSAGAPTAVGATCDACARLARRGFALHAARAQPGEGRTT